MAEILTLTIRIDDKAYKAFVNQVENTKEDIIAIRDQSVSSVEIMYKEFISFHESEIKKLQEEAIFFEALRKKNQSNEIFDLFSALKDGDLGEAAAILEKIALDTKSLTELWVSIFKSIGTLSQKQGIEDTLKRGTLFPEGVGPLTPEMRKELEDKLPALNERIEELILEQDNILKELSVREDPFAFKLEEIRKDIEFHQQKIKELEEGLRQRQDLKIEDFNIEDTENIFDIFKKIQKDRNENTSEAINVHKEFIGILKQDEESLLSLRDKYALLTDENVFYTDAVSQATETTSDLINKGINPLTGKASELGISFEDLFQNTSEGALILGYTKEELLGLRDATDEATKSTENLGENGFTAVKENVEQAGNKLGTLDTNLMNVADRNKDVANSQDQVNQAVGESGVVYDGASESAERYGDTIEEVQNKGGFFEGIKQGFKDFVENVQSNSELMADFFADTLSQMSQNFSDLFFNVLTGKFDDLKDLAKQAFEAILRAFLDLVSAIVTKQIVISIAGVFGFGKDAGAGDLLGFGKQAAGIGADLAGIFGGGGGAAAGGVLGGGAALGGGISAIGAGAGAAGGATSVGASLGLTGISSVGTGAAGGATGVGASLGLSGISSVPTAPGFLAGIGGVAGAITIVGAVLAAAALAFTIIAPFLKKTPRLDIDFDSVKTEAGRRAALVSELLDDDFLKDEIIDISVKRKAGLGLGGDEGIKDVLADAIQGAVNNLLDIINKLPTDLAETLSEELLNTPLDTETEVAGERLFEFDAKGGKEIKTEEWEYRLAA